MSEGTVIVRAYTSRAQIPVADTTIIITQYNSDGTTELLAVRQTDQSGRTDPITVQTPDVTESLAPQASQPYTLINIDAFHPNYERILIEHAQVFPDVRTVQNLTMIPREEYPSSFHDTEVFDLPPQNL